MTTLQTILFYLGAPTISLGLLVSFLGTGIWALGIAILISWSWVLFACAIALGSIVYILIRGMK